MDNELVKNEETFRNAVLRLGELGCLNYNQLIGDGILHIAFQNDKTSFPITTNFKVAIDNDPCICLYGQMDEEGKLHGIARCISYKGHIYDGNFKHGMKHGWIREISNDELCDYYTVKWLNLDDKQRYFPKILRQFENIERLQ